MSVLESVEHLKLDIMAGVMGNNPHWLVLSQESRDEIESQSGVYIRSSMFTNWHPRPDLPNAIQVDVRKAEGRLLMQNIIALRQDRPPRIYNLSDTDISRKPGEQPAPSGRPNSDEYTIGPDVPKGMDSRVDAPWHGPSLLWFVSVVRLRRRPPRMSVFLLHGFEGASPNVPLQS